MAVAKDSKYVALMQWMKQNGFNCKQNLLQPAEFKETGRGLRARKPFKSGDTIIRVPKNLILTTSSALRSPLGEAMKGWKDKLTPTQVICLFLIHETAQQANSFWWPYIETLPESYTNAAYWDDCELSLLPERLIQSFINQRQVLEKSYRKVVPFVTENQKAFSNMHKYFTFDSYRWAWSAINTRTVYMKQDKISHLSDEEVDHFAMIPFLDLLNHTSDVEVEAGFDMQEQAFRIQAVTPVQKYDQAFINYGPHSNVKLLAEYGFALKSNVNNFYPIYLDDVHRVAITCGLKNINEKLRLVTDEEMHKDMSISISGLSWNLELVLRLLSVEKMTTDLLKRIRAGNQLDHPNENRMLNFAKTLIKDLLKEPLNQISGDSLSFKEEMANQINSDSKDVLEKSLNDIENKIKNPS